MGRKKMARKAVLPLIFAFSSTATISHRHSEDAEVDGVPVCLPEFRIAEHFKVVFQTAELIGSKGFRLGKTHVDGLEERDNIQDHQTEDGGSYHDQPPETPIPAQL